jgi:hypothetical protein
MKTGEMASCIEEKDCWLGEIARKAMLSRPVSPSATKCPDPEIIRELAFRKKVSPEITKEVALHLAECPDCARTALNYREEYRRQVRNYSA